MPHEATLILWGKILKLPAVLDNNNKLIKLIKKCAGFVLMEKIALWQFSYYCNKRIQWHI